MSATEQIQSLDLEDIRLILKDFLKVIKVVSMYPEDNPLPQSLRRTFAEHLVKLVNNYGQLDFLITAESLRYNGETVFIDKSREESLAGLFFESGITRLTFKNKLQVDEIYRLLDTIKVYQGSDRRTRDLVASLWEAGFKQISYETVEDVALRQYDGNSMVQEIQEGAGFTYGAATGESVQDYQAIFSQSERDFGDTNSRIEVGFLAGEGDESAPPANVLSTGDEKLDKDFKVSEAADAMGLSDLAGAAPRLLDTKLILSDEHRLSEEEFAQVAALVRRDAEFAEYESSCELVKELLHQEAEMSDFYETVTIGERILTEFVKAGKLTYAADLFRYFAQLEEKLGKDKPMWAQRLKDARTTAGARERLGILCRSLNENSEIGNLELRRYLENFEWEALLAITDMIGELQHNHHREAVKDYLIFRGRDRLHILAKGLTDRRPEVVAMSVNVLATIGTTDALKLLGGVVRHRDIAIRSVLVKTLAESSVDCSLPMLQELAGDADESIRQVAVRSIVKRRGQPAFDALTEIINGDRFADFGTDDQISILIAYSRLGGDAAVDYLVELAEKPNLLRNRGLALYREAAFEALAHNRGEKAERTLVRLAGSWRADLKAHARAALQRRRELIYGGADD